MSSPHQRSQSRLRHLPVSPHLVSSPRPLATTSHRRGDVAAQRSQIERFISDHEKSNGDLARKARGLLLHLDGYHDHEIATMTGMTSYSVMCTRRRYNQWGLACLADPPPRPNVRTSLGPAGVR